MLILLYLFFFLIPLFITINCLIYNNKKNSHSIIMPNHTNIFYYIKVLLYLNLIIIFFTSNISNEILIYIYLFIIYYFNIYIVYLFINIFIYLF